MGHASLGWCGSCRGVVGHAVHVGGGVGWVNNSYSFKNSQMDMRGVCMSGVMFLKGVTCDR